MGSGLQLSKTGAGRPGRRLQRRAGERGRSLGSKHSDTDGSEFLRDMSGDWGEKQGDRPPPHSLKQVFLLPDPSQAVPNSIPGNPLPDLWPYLDSTPPSQLNPSPVSASESGVSH